MRVALVTREFPPETAWGGIGAFYASFALALTAAGHEVEVFTQGLTKEAVDTRDGFRVVRVLGHSDAFGAKAQGAEAGNDDLGLFALGLARALHRAVAMRHAEAPFDLIEGHEHLGVMALINLDPTLRAPRVTRYHAAYHSLVRRGLVDWPASRLVEALERAGIVAADHRISISQAVSGAAAEDFGAPKADVVIPNFVAPASRPPAWSAKKDQVLFVGRLVLDLKRPDIAIEAFSQFARSRPGWRMLLVGLDQEHRDHGSVWAHLSKSIPASMKGRITHLGDQPHAAVQSLMAESKALLMPSEFESFGLVAVEAMQQGCVPLVAEGTGTAETAPTPELVRRRGSAASFAEGLEHVVGDARRGARLSKAVQAHAEARFGAERIMSDNLAFLERCAQGAQAPDNEAVFGPDAPRVSVVVPNFNGGRFLRPTLQSLVDQDYPNLEIILVDGGSTDDSLEIAARYRQVRVISEPDHGQSHAINRGLLQARGDILAYLNSDDLYQPGAVKAVVERFRREPNTQIICGGCEVIDEAGQTVGDLILPRFTGQQGVIRYWGWGRWHAIPQPATFWRRGVTERVGLFDTGLEFAMDLDFWIRAADLFDIRAAPETLAAFRLAQGSKTVSQTDKMYAEEHQVFRRYRSRLPLVQRPFATLAAATHHSGKLLGVAEHLYLTERLRRRGLEMAIKSVRVFPPRALDPRVWFIAGNVVASAMRLSGLADRVHRRLLALMPRPSRWARP